MPLLGGECLVSNIESENSRNREYRIVSESADALGIGIAQQQPKFLYVYHQWDSSMDLKFSGVNGLEFHNKNKQKKPQILNMNYI